MSKTDILHSGKIYNPNDDGIMQEQKERLRMLKDYNDTDPADFELREKKLRVMFEYFGKNAYIEIPFRQTEPVNSFILVTAAMRIST